ncbi:hypothetical protein [Agrococcus beijingensis]|uniref:hypothetical protein n=1 Tax=Agrococcus beijingensis TaxID=3068634 RepID=UPI002741A810|nr:hypothetical protein [Agrococcus sp. REN33]
MSKPVSAKRRAAVRRRRTLLGLLALVAIAAVVLLVWRPWASADAPPATAPTDAAPATTESAAPVATPTPTPTGPFTPIGGAPSAAPTEPCAPEAIRLSPVTDKTAYAPGERVQLSFTIENIGESACSVNAGTSVQEYEIRTGDLVVHRWSDCAADVQDNVVQLEPGTPQATVPVEWDRTASSIETCTAERPQVTAGGAAYNLSVRVGDYASTESRQFILE